MRKPDNQWRLSGFRICRANLLLWRHALIEGLSPLKKELSGAGSLHRCIREPGAGAGEEGRVNGGFPFPVACASEFRRAVQGFVDVVLHQAIIDNAKAKQPDQQKHHTAVIRHFPAHGAQLIALSAHFVIPEQGVQTAGDDGKQQHHSAAWIFGVIAQAVHFIVQHNHPINAVYPAGDKAEDDRHNDVSSHKQLLDVKDCPSYRWECLYYTQETAVCQYCSENSIKRNVRKFYKTKLQKTFAVAPCD